MEAMDFMDPKRRRQQTIMLFIGYALVGVALVLLTVILIFVAYGFGYKNGQVIQNGLVFLSSTPNPGQIYLNGERYKNDTNTQIVLPAGTYNVVLKRSGYRDWQRAITVDGGQVQTYAYPFFFPLSLTTNTKHEYASPPTLVSESADRRWLLVAQPGALTSFDVYDLNNPKKDPVVITLPAGILAAGTTQSFDVITWADDNTHILLRHVYDGNAEYILLNRDAPDQSVNVSRTLGLAAQNISVQLYNKKYDQFLIYSATQHELLRASLSSPTPQPLLSNVLTYANSGSEIAFISPDVSDVAKVDVELYDGSNTYLVRRNTANTTHLLALATYSGDLYMAVSASSENVAYVYKNPIDQITNPRLGAALPVQVFSIKAPNFTSFSANAQYVMFENGTNLAVYDIENDQAYNYSVPDGLDTPQTHAAWMDGARLTYVSKGQVVVFDYDGQNRQVLVSADPRYPLVFDQPYKFLYAFVPSAADKSHELLTSTSLRTPADQ